MISRKENVSYKYKMPCSVGRNTKKYGGTVVASTLQDVTENGNTTTLSIQTDGFFIGDGSLLTNIPGFGGYGNLEQVTTTGNATSHEVTFENTFTSLQAMGNVVVLGNVTALSFHGDGSNLTGIMHVDNVIRIENLESNLVANSERIDDLVTDLGSNVSRIINLESNLVANSERIDDLVTDLGSNVSRIVNLESNLVANSERIDDLVTDLGSNVSRIVNLESNLVANSERIDDLVTDLGSNVSRIVNLESNLVANSERIDDLVTDLGSNVSRIINLESNLVANSERIDDLETSAIISNSSTLTGFIQGDILYASATNTLTALSIGPVGNVLTVTGPGNIAWQPPTGGGGGSEVGNLQDVTTNGPTTSIEVSFTNTTTSFRASGNVVISGNVTAQTYYGDGSNLSGIMHVDNVIRIENLESNLVANSERIDDLETVLGSNVTRIINLESNLVANSERIDDLETYLGSNVTRIINLESNLNANSERIDDLETYLGSNVLRIINLESNLNANSERIDDLETYLGSNVTRIINLESNLVANSERIDVLENLPIVANTSTFTGVSKGDLLYASLDNQITALTLSATDGHVLTADTSTGLPAWKAPAGGGNNITESGGFTGISNTNPQYTLQVGSNVVIDDTGSEVIYVIGNVYSTNQVIAVRGVRTNAVHTGSLFIKNSTVIAERPTRKITLT